MDEKMGMSRVWNKDNNYKDEDDDEAVLLPGFRFHPTDEELVGFYLRRKVEKKPLSVELIKQVDIYKYDPWDLPKFSMVGEKEWYFFCMRGRKYRNSIRPNRVTKSGFWKATGIDKPIFATGNQETFACIGLKKSLVYYIGSAGKGTKTEWMMHEFRLPPTWKNTNQQINAKNKDITTLEAEVWTLCRILKRNASFRKNTPPHRKQDTSEQIAKDESSVSFSLEHNQNINSRNLLFQQKRAKNHVEERKQDFQNQQNSTVHTANTVSQLSNGNTNRDEFRVGNWDELRTVVELAVDPFSLYQYR